MSCSNKVLPEILKTGQKAIIQYLVKDNFGDNPILHEEFEKSIEFILEQAKGQVFIQYVDEKGELVPGYSSMMPPSSENIPKILMAAPTEENIELAMSKGLALVPIQSLGEDKDLFPVMAYQADLVLAFGVGSLKTKDRHIDEKPEDLENLALLHSQLVDFDRRIIILSSDRRMLNFQAMRFPTLSNGGLLQNLLIVPLSRLKLDEFIQLVGARLAAVGHSA